MANQDKLSQRQQSILSYVWSYWKDSGRPPTIREIGRAANISSTSVVNYNLTKLEEKGFLEREAEVSRGLKLTEKALALYDQVRDAVDGMLRIPLVGDIVAGQPVQIGHDRRCPTVASSHRQPAGARATRRPRAIRAGHFAGRQRRSGDCRKSRAVS